MKIVRRPNPFAREDRRTDAMRVQCRLDLSQRYFRYRLVNRLPMTRWPRRGGEL